MFLRFLIQIETKWKNEQMSLFNAGNSKKPTKYRGKRHLFIDTITTLINTISNKQTNAYLKSNFKTLRGTDAKSEEKQEENTL